MLGDLRTFFVEDVIKVDPFPNTPDENIQFRVGLGFNHFRCRYPSKARQILQMFFVVLLVFVQLSTNVLYLDEHEQTMYVETKHHRSLLLQDKS